MQSLEDLNGQLAFSKLIAVINESWLDENAATFLETDENTDSDAAIDNEEDANANDDKENQETNAQVIEDLLTLIADNPGDTELYIQVVAANQYNKVTLRGRAGRVKITRAIVDFFRQHPGLQWSLE